MPAMRTTTKLRMYDNHIVEPVGKAALKYTNPKNKKKYKAEFVVVDDDNMIPILGRDTSLKMQLIELKTENIMQIKEDPVEQWTSKYPDVFEGLGAFEEECHLTMEENATPVAHPPERCQSPPKRYCRRNYRQTY